MTTPPTIVPTEGRGDFAGVIKIFRFNVQFYLVSALGIVGAGFLVASRRLPQSLQLLVLCGAAVALFWILSSLLVSWYVYDHVGVARWQWLPPRLPVPLHRWANIHAGFDESTAALRHLFPQTEGSVIDIYDSQQMTEPSIARARRFHPSTEQFRSGKHNALPLPDNDYDAVFLLFAAHEVRAPEHRTELLRESARVLRDTGHVVLVEHLRDWKNFLAFGPGFLHFYSRQNWLRSARNAGLSIEQESQITPFVACFVLRRPEP